jgi:hypothetical protein
MEIEKVVGKDTTIVKDDTKRGIRMKRYRIIKGCQERK